MFLAAILLPIATAVASWQPSAYTSGGAIDTAEHHARCGAAHAAVGKKELRSCKKGEWGGMGRLCHGLATAAGLHVAQVEAPPVEVSVHVIPCSPPPTPPPSPFPQLHGAGARRTTRRMQLCGGIMVGLRDKLPKSPAGRQI